jgi:hypothetical protein
MLQRVRTYVILFVALFLGVGTAAGQSLDDIRLTEVHEGEQWFEIVNTGSSAVDVSTAELCANFRYEEVQDLTVKAYDDQGNEDLTLEEGEYLALEWGEVDADNGDLGLYQSGTGNFGNPSNIIDYVRWGSNGSEADRESTADEAGIWNAGDYVEPAQDGATIAFLGSAPAMNDNSDDWGEGNPTPGSGNVVLPVELTSFDAVVNGSNVLLTWTTASETNNSGFEVQHRKDEAFEKVGFVDGAGTTTQSQSYRFRLTDLSPGQHAFRLKQVDLDGSVEFGPTVETTIRARVLSEIRPNPASDRAQLTLSVKTPQSVTVEVYNLLGQQVRTVFDGPVTPGRVRTFAVDGTQLSSGSYFVHIAGEQFEETRKFVVAK